MYHYFLDDVSLEDECETRPSGLRFSDDVIVHDGETGESAIIGLSEIDGPHYTVKHYLFQQCALQNYSASYSSLRSLGLVELDGSSSGSLRDNSGSNSGSLSGSDTISEPPSIPDEGSRLARNSASNTKYTPQPQLYEEDPLYDVDPFGTQEEETETEESVEDVEEGDLYVDHLRAIAAKEAAREAR